MRWTPTLLPLLLLRSASEPHSFCASPVLLVWELFLGAFRCVGPVQRVECTYHTTFTTFALHTVHRYGAPCMLQVLHLNLLPRSKNERSTTRRRCTTTALLWPHCCSGATPLHLCRNARCLLVLLCVTRLTPHLRVTARCREVAESHNLPFCRVVSNGVEKWRVRWSSILLCVAGGATCRCIPRASTVHACVYGWSLHPRPWRVDSLARRWGVVVCAWVEVGG